MTAAPSPQRIPLIFFRTWLAANRPGVVTLHISPSSGGELVLPSVQSRRFCSLKLEGKFSCHPEFTPARVLGTGNPFRPTPQLYWLRADTRGVTFPA